jgi:hypothetical protein
MPINHHPLFDNHPIEIKQQYDQLTKLQRLTQLKRINNLEVIAFKPVTVKFHRIHWDTLNTEEDTILVTLDNGETLSVSYVTMATLA